MFLYSFFFPFSLVYGFEDRWKVDGWGSGWMKKRMWDVPDKWMKNKLWLWMNQGDRRRESGAESLFFFLSFFLKSRGSLGADFSCDNDDESPQLSDVDNVDGWMDG